MASPVRRPSPHVIPGRAGRIGARATDMTAMRRALRRWPVLLYPDTTWWQSPELCKALMRVAGITSGPLPKAGHHV